MASAVVINSGSVCSSAFALTRATFALVAVDSGAPANVRIAFAPSLTSNSAAFAVLQGDNTGAPYLVLSGGTQLCSQPIPAITAVARIVLSAAPTWPVSFTLLPLNIP